MLFVITNNPSEVKCSVFVFRADTGRCLSDGRYYLAVAMDLNHAFGLLRKINSSFKQFRNAGSPKPVFFMRRFRGGFEVSDSQLMQSGIGIKGFAYGGGGGWLKIGNWQQND